MIKKLLHSKKGEGYVDMCVGVVVFVMILVIAINIFEFITLRIEMDQIADDLIEAATYAGCFDDDFWNADGDMLDQYYYYDIDYGADRYFNSSAAVNSALPERQWRISSISVSGLPMISALHLQGTGSYSSVMPGKTVKQPLSPADFLSVLLSLD